MSYEIIEKLKKQISDFKDSSDTVSVGTVVEVGDGIAKVSGLTSALSQELLSIETKNGKLPAIAFSLEENFIGAIILAEASLVSVGDSVYGTKQVLSIPVSDEIIGRVVNPLGENQDGKGVIGGSLKNYAIERKAPGVIERKSVSVPLHTGIKAIDSMIPIGRGQRELIIGDRQTGKTSIAIDVILNQKNDVSSSRKQVKCVYVAIGQKNSKVAQIVRTLTEAGAMEYTTVVLASASHSASLQYLAPFAGSAIAEYFMDKGDDVLIIYDDLSKHADAYRQLSLLLRRSPGREAYPGDIFYLHSRLLERSARLSDENGGWSITALPIIETKLGDVSAYVPTNVISITDGQIYLESNLFYQGIRPAVNVGLSVSRVGSSAQTKAMKKVAGKLRLELAQFRELQAFAQFASDLDENTRNKIKKGELLTEILKQTDGNPMPFENQVVLLYATLNGYLSSVSKGEIKSVEKELLEFLEIRHEKDVIEPLRTSGEMKEETEKSLKSALESFGKK